CRAVTPAVASARIKCLAMNSGPLSLRTNCGVPCCSKNLSSASATNRAFIRYSVSTVTHSLVNSSITVKIRSFRPDSVRSSTTSARQRTWPPADSPSSQLLFLQELLHHVQLQVPLGQEPLEPTVLLLQLPQPLHLRLAHRPQLLLPHVKRRLRKTALTTDLRN